MQFKNTSGMLQWSELNKSERARNDVGLIMSDSRF